MARRSSLKKRNTSRRKVSNRNKSMRRKLSRRNRSLRKKRATKRIKSFGGGPRSSRSEYTIKESGNQNHLGKEVDSHDGRVYTPVLYLLNGSEYTQLVAIKFNSTSVFYTIDGINWTKTDKKNIYIGADYVTDENRPYFR